MDTRSFFVHCHKGIRAIPLSECFTLSVDANDSLQECCHAAMLTKSLVYFL